MERKPIKSHEPPKTDTADGDDKESEGATHPNDTWDNVGWMLIGAMFGVIGALIVVVVLLI